MEMMVVMLISSIVMMLCIACFHLILTQFLAFQKMQERRYDKILVDRLLTRDVSDCLRIVKTADGFSCAYRSRRVVYRLLDDVMVRKDSTLLDSLYLPFSQLQLLWAGEKVVETGEMIDNVTLKFEQEAYQLSWSYQKQYSAETWMKKHYKAH
jgi:hypothetical protein